MPDYISSRASGAQVDADLDMGVAAFNRTTHIDNTSDMDKPISTAQGVAIAATNTEVAKIENRTRDSVLHMQNIVSKYGALVGVIRINLPVATSMAMTVKVTITSQANTANRLATEIIVGFNPLANASTLPYNTASIIGNSGPIKLIRIANTTPGNLPVLLIGDVGQNLPNCLVTVTAAYVGAGTTPVYPKTGWTIETKSDLVGLTLVGTIATTMPVLGVNGRTGAVTLASSDVGLGNVDNTRDIDKPVSTAQAAAIAGIALTPGPVGPVGPPGTNGTNGSPGEAATITVGTTTTLAPGSSATITEAEGSTPQNRVLNFGVPEGKPGESGTSGGASATLVDFSVASTAWGWSGTHQDFVVQADVTIPGLTAMDSIIAMYDPASQLIVNNAFILAAPDVLDGKFRMYAMKIPSGTINGTLQVLKGGA